VPRPWARAMAVASTVATRNPGNRPARASGASGLLISTQPPAFRPWVTPRPARVGSRRTTWSGVWIGVRRVMGSGEKRQNAWIGAPARSAA
jgi:hypothetical protein